MLIGYNTNIPYKGRMYHVQTEDSGLNNPHVITLLYYKGAILRSVKTGYEHLIGSTDFEERLRELMKHQHREMIKDLIHGRCFAEHAEGGKGEGAADVAVKETDDASQEKTGSNAKGHARSLDDILLEHISRKVKR